MTGGALARRTSHEGFEPRPLRSRWSLVVYYESHSCRSSALTVVRAEFTSPEGFGEPPQCFHSSSLRSEEKHWGKRSEAKTSRYRVTRAKPVCYTVTMTDEYNTQSTRQSSSTNTQERQESHLEPLSPEDCLEIHLKRIGEDHTESTVTSHKSRLQFFIDFCEEEDIKNLNNLTGRDILRYRSWRSEDIAKTTLKTALDTLRVYLRTAVRANAVDPRLPETMDPPTLSEDESSREQMVSQERAEEILSYLRKYDYASFDHCLMELLWHTGMRRGAAHGLDLEDLHLDEQYVEIHHRQEQGTPLKNESKGERPVAISDKVCTVIDDWIDQHRPDVTDDHGRKPLLTTTQGRAHCNTLQTAIYAVTRPCMWADCPHDKDPDTCSWAINRNKAHHCPSTVATHALRRGALTHWLSNDWPVEQVSDRADVSAKVLERHYDARSELSKMEQRRDRLDSI